MGFLSPPDPPKVPKSLVEAEGPSEQEIAEAARKRRRELSEATGPLQTLISTFGGNSGRRKSILGG